MAYVLKYPKHHDPTTRADAPDAPAGEWLISEGDPPLNVLRNPAPDGIPTFEVNQDPHNARAHVTALREAWELRQKAAKRVAES